MTPKDRELVLKDISARLPYGVVLDIDTTDWKAPQGHIKIKVEGYGIIFKDMSLIINGCYYGDNYKPYLRPMSSITNEEKKEIKPFFSELREETGRRVLVVRQNEMPLYQDYLNAHFLDYRGLIPKGLALEAPEGMYKVGREQV